MNKYELLYIISAGTTDEQKEELVAKFKDFVEKNNGTVETVDKWGMKKFAYPIQFKKEGFYVLMNFTAEPELVEKMNKLMLVTENIVRQMFVKK